MATGSVQFTGKVGQAAAGDVINKAPQYSNSVNVNIAPGVAPARSGQCLTAQQKDVLAKLILEIASKKNCDKLDIWRPVLARAGAKKAREIPIEEYRQLEDFLRQQLAEVVALPVASPALVTANPPLPPEQPHQAPVAKPIDRAQASKLPHWLAACSLLMAVASGAAVLDTRFQLDQISERMLSGNQSCQYAGQPYSQGSVVSHAAGPMRCDASETETDGATRWVAVEQAKAKRGK